MTHRLSPREEEIVSLAMEGFTNEGIATSLGLSIGTVNTYWQRIRMKLGAHGRTDAVAMIAAERASELARIEGEFPEILAAVPHHDVSLEVRAALSLMQLAMDESRSTIWAVNHELRVQTIASVDMPSTPDGQLWEVGKTLYEMFGTEDDAHPAIAAHLLAIGGREARVEFPTRYGTVRLRAIPLLDGVAENIGCIGVVTVVDD